MNVRNMTMAVVAVIIGVLVCTSVLIPIVSGLDYGRSTYNNSTNIQFNYGVSNEEVPFKAVAQTDASGLIITLDGSDSVYHITSRENYVFLSDKCAIIQSWNNVGSFGAYGWFFNEEGTAVNNISSAAMRTGTFTYDPATKIAKFESPTLNYSAEVTWQYHMDRDGPYRTYQLPSGGSWYANPDNLVIAGGGYYTTGDNDTTYAYYAFNGANNLSVGASYAEESHLNLTSTSINDSVTQNTITISIGDESFSPWNVIIPKEVTSTNNSSLEAIISIIPLLVLTGLVIGVVGSFIRNRD